MTSARNGIRFPDGSNDWGAINRIEAYRLAIGGYEIDMPTRAMFLAMSKSNKIGHATFRPREAQGLLLRHHKGTLQPLSDHAFGDALNRAIERGLLEGQEARRCLILPPLLWQQSRYGSLSCDYCGVGQNYRKLDRLAYERAQCMEVEVPDSDGFMQKNFHEEEVLLPALSL